MEIRRAQVPAPSSIAKRRLFEAMETIRRINDTGWFALLIMFAAGYCVAWLLGFFAGAVLS